MYGIMRCEKVKTWGHVAAVAGHHARTRPTPNANSTVPNRWLVGSPTSDISQSVRNLISGRKIRKGGVLAIEVVMTATPEFFRPGSPGQAGHYDPARLDDFQKRAMAWLEHTFGSGNIASAVVHLDESSPHIQAVVVPIDPDTDRLNASRWLDGAKKLSVLQDTFAEWVCRPLGLSRGIKGSKAKHGRVAEFYAAVNASEPPTVPVVVVQPPPTMFGAAARREWSAAESARIDAEQRPSLQPVADLAAAAHMAKRKQRDAEATAQAAQTELDQMRRDANLVRDIPLIDVLERSGYVRDGIRWVGPAGVITLDVKAGKARFLNNEKIAGTGAIDLAKHLHALDYRGAVAWLGSEIGRAEAIGAALAWAKGEAEDAVKDPVPLPIPEPALWPRVREYMTETHGIGQHVVDWLHEKGKLFADRFANAVFLYSECGAELRGTGARKWYGFRGSRKGTFWVRREGNLALGVCGSAIEALSYAQLYNDQRDAVAVAGRNDLDVARKALAKGQTVYAAYGADATGDRSAQRLIDGVPGVLRDRPVKGWNDDLLARRGSDGGEGQDEDRRLGGGA